MVELIGKPMSAWIAKALLMQAGVPPAKCDCPAGEQCGCQYEIESFRVDVTCVRITDAGKITVLRARKIS